jgi:hypothetical protein
VGERELIILILLLLIIIISMRFLRGRSLIFKYYVNNSQASKEPVKAQ